MAHGKSARERQLIYVLEFLSIPQTASSTLAKIKSKQSKKLFIFDFKRESVVPDQKMQPQFQNCHYFINYILGGLSKHRIESRELYSSAVNVWARSCEVVGLTKQVPLQYS